MNESLWRLIVAYVTVGVIAVAITGSAAPLLVCILAAATCCWFAWRFLR